MSTSIRPAASHDDRATALARLFEAVHEGVYIGLLSTAGPDLGPTLAANAHLKALLGYPRSTPESEVLPFVPSRFVDPAVRTALFQQLRTEGSVTDFPALMRRNDGSVITIEITARADLDRTPWVSVEALVRSTGLGPGAGDWDERVHSERLAALGQAISSVAHELNNPLATIISWSERLAERSDEVSRRGVGIIAAEAQRAARIVRNLLTFSRRRQTTRTLVDLNQIARDTLALRSHDHRLLNIDVKASLSPDLPEALADGHQIQQVLLNLVINAEQAMTAAHGGGTLVVRTAHAPDRAKVVLEVADDGPGVPLHALDRIFDPFFTTKEAGEGTGLGLAVADGIVREHGGEIRVAPRLPRGASFFVELPVQDPAMAASARVPLLPAALRGATVLLVEDERGLAAAVRESLTDAGLNVDHAGNGEDALARVRQRGYDVVVCDLQMPHMNGMMLYRAIAAATPALARRVIFVTGEVAGADAERFLADSGCRWLAKPFRFDDLMRAVRDTLA